MASNPFADGISVSVDADTTGFRNGIGGAITRLGDFRTEIALAGGAVATLSAAGLAKGASAFADFDEAMNESLAIMGDVSEAMEEDMVDAALSVGEETQFSSDQAAESFYFLASAGLDAQEAVTALPQVADFAQAGQMDMAEATDTATNVLSAYGLEAENLSDITDTMTETVNNHNQTMPGMSAAFKNAAPAAASMGIEIEELAAMTGALGDVGIQGAEAGTALNSIMRRFAKDSGKASQVMEEIGVEAMDADGNMRPLTEIFGDLQEAELDAAQSSALFGRQMSAGNALLSTGQEELESYQARVGDAGGVTEEVAEKQLDTLNAQWGLFTDRIENVFISIGQQLAPVLTDLLSILTKGVNLFADLNQATNGILAPILLVTGVVGGLTAAFVALAPPIAAIATGVVALGAPILAIVAAIGVLAYAWTQNWFGIQDITMQVLDVVKGVIDAALAFITDLWEQHGQFIVDKAVQTFSEIGKTVEHWVGVVLDVVMWFVDKAMAFWNTWGDEIVAVITTVVDIVAPMVEGFLDGILTAVQVVMALVRGDFDEAWSKIRGLFDRQVDRMKGIVGDITDAITGALPSVDDMLGIGKDIVDGLIDGITDMIPDVKGAVEGLADTISGGLPGSDAEWGPLSNITDQWAAVGEVGVDQITAAAGDVGGATDELVGAAEPINRPQPVLGVEGASGRPESTGRTDDLVAEMRAVREETRQVREGTREVREAVHDQESPTFRDASRWRETHR